MAAAHEPTGVPNYAEKEAGISDDTQQRSGLKQKVDEKLLKHSHDADAAMQAFEGLDGQVIELTEEKNKELLRKIDWHLMPVSHKPQYYI